ncbi:MAG: SusC/RagA family TonB-linked outer membrane protein [Sediminicola sp.]
MKNNRPKPFFQLVFYALLFVSYQLAAQGQAISGTLTDALGPIPGVHILIKGQHSGTFSDQDGRYQLTAGVSDTLVFTYLGHKTVELPVGSHTQINVQLKEDVTALQEVEVNAGYYTVKERERTGNISKVTAEEIELQPIVSPLQTLEGRMPGVEVEQGSGITGLAPTIRIRGTNSLRSDGNHPLFIVDGIPLNSMPLNSVGELTSQAGLDPLSTLNLNNIESIEVLKDADATAIYGSRGANGIVLITTKKGRGNEGRTLVDINLYTGISQAANKLHLLSTPQYISMREAAFENDGVTPTEGNAPDLLLWDRNGYTDWQDRLFGASAFSKNINVALSGGDQYTSYRIGGSFHKQGSVFPGDLDYTKGTVNIHLGQLSKDHRFKLDLSVNYGVDNNHLFFGNNFVNSALVTPPNAPPVYREDGSLNWENWVGSNPLAVLEQPQETKTDNLLANLGLSYSILTGLDLKVNLGYSKLDNQELIKFYKEAYNPSLWDFIALSTNNFSAKRRSWIIEPQAAYTRTVGKLAVDVLLGGTFQNDRNSYLGIEGRGYADRSLMDNLASADESRILANENVDYRYVAGFGRVGLNWDMKYFLNLTGRRDGSSRFGADRRFSNFWAVGGAWIFSGEKWFKDRLPFLSFGKLRGSYGTTGSDQIGDYGFLDTYEATSGAGGLYPTQLYNPEYSWEVNKKLEAALQIGLFNDRADMEVSWYRNRSSNQLVGYPLPAITGFTSVQANLPALVENTGWEIQLSTANIRGRDFSWDSSLNLTFPNSRLVEFENIDRTSYANRYRVGHPLNISLGYRYDGIDPETGLYQVVDVNGDGRFNNDDRVVITDMGRAYYGGLSNQFRYKGLSLQLLFEYIAQKNTSYIFGASAPGTFNNKPVEFLNAWERPGDPENIQKVSQSGQARTAFNNAARSSLNIEDASFLRLKNLSLSYHLPGTVLEKLNVRTGAIFVRAQNLLTFTDYRGLDPQGGTGAVPPLRTITCGLQLTL